MSGHAYKPRVGEQVRVIGERKLPPGKFIGIYDSVPGQPLAVLPTAPIYVVEFLIYGLARKDDKTVRMYFEKLKPARGWAGECWTARREHILATVLVAVGGKPVHPVNTT